MNLSAFNAWKSESLRGKEITRETKKTWAGQARENLLTFTSSTWVELANDAKPKEWAWSWTPQIHFFKLRSIELLLLKQ
ncbi:unnamed protein product [Camellia sinensis]